MRKLIERSLPLFTHLCPPYKEGSYEFRLKHPEKNIPFCALILHKAYKTSSCKSFTTYNNLTGPSIPSE